MDAVVIDGLILDVFAFSIFRLMEERRLITSEKAKMRSRNNARYYSNYYRFKNTRILLKTSSQNKTTNHSKTNYTHADDS